MLNPRCNALLDRLPEQDYERLLPHLNLVSLRQDQQIYLASDRADKVYFPVTALIAFARDLDDGSAIDTACIGAEGVVGLRGLVGTSLHRVYVASSGLAYLMDLSHLVQAFHASPAIAAMCMQAGSQILKNTSLELACSHFHPIGQRLAKWVLMRHDRSGSPQIEVTHQAIALSLGTRREAVTHACQSLPGLRPGRGHLEITDRAALERHCCECYFLQKETHAGQMDLPFRALVQS